MSIKITSAVWEYSKQEGSNLLILLALADMANDEGVCWPSVGRLALKGRIGDRSVQRILRHLEDEKEITTDTSAGNKTVFGKTNLYRINTERYGVTPMSPGDANATGGVTRVTRGGVMGVTQNRKEPSLEPSYKTKHGGAKNAEGSPELSAAYDHLLGEGGAETGDIYNHLHVQTLPVTKLRDTAEQREATSTLPKQSGRVPKEPDVDPAKPKRAKPKTVATAFPEDFSVTMEMYEWAFNGQGIGSVVIDNETAAFVDHHIAKGSKFVDWTAAWRNWIRNAVKYNRTPPQNTPNGQTAAKDGGQGRLPNVDRVTSDSKNGPVASKEDFDPERESEEYFCLEDGVNHDIHLIREKCDCGSAERNGKHRPYCASVILPRRADTHRDRLFWTMNQGDTKDDFKGFMKDCMYAGIPREEANQWREELKKELGL